MYQAVALQCRCTERRIFHASQLAEGLVKELDGPSLCQLPLDRFFEQESASQRQSTISQSEVGNSSITIQEA